MSKDDIPEEERSKGRFDFYNPCEKCKYVILPNGCEFSGVNCYIKELEYDINILKNENGWLKHKLNKIRDLVEEEDCNELDAANAIAAERLRTIEELEERLEQQANHYDEELMKSAFIQEKLRNDLKDAKKCIIKHHDVDIAKKVTWGSPCPICSKENDNE